MNQDLSVHPERPKTKQWSSMPAIPCQPRKEHSRRIVRLTTPQTHHIPIPPSLLQSPFLTSPHSIFQRPLSLPSTPTEEDETWLRDTVPIVAGENSKDGRESKENHGLLVQTSRGSGAEKSEESQKEDYGARPSGVEPKPCDLPASPPLVRIRQHYPTGKLRSHSKRSRIRILEDDYFHV
ncbi:hypothetical protein Moror_8894 [Moniliophthora roreri MCA 2997]|uniref:Uncharacterized protein n=1 Tax=Moniliophthora roreri (strain MCA 2997) TaxID=1381753 RepID=V2XJF2_MONRO|nr:hypothetical protein Moror_8894 [Moniliophthora roreri MCA 2997]